MADMEFHPLSEDYPLMPEAELAVLIEDMKEHGFDPQFPIIIYQEKILDGRNRYRAAVVAEIEFPTQRFFGSEEEAKRHVERANEHRRHLAQEWIKRRAEERRQRVAAARQQGMSTRAIAEQEEVAQTQVLRDLKASGEPGGSPETVKGKDDKEYPARKPKLLCPDCKRKGPRRDCAKCKEVRQAAKATSKKTEREPGEDDAEADVVIEKKPVDRLGIPLEGKGLEAFAIVDRFKELLKLLKDAGAIVDEIAREPGGYWLRKSCSIHSNDNNETQKFIFDKLKHAASDIKKTMPYTAVCPYCFNEGKKNSKSCKLCDGAAAITERTFDNAPEEMRRAVQALAEGKA